MDNDERAVQNGIPQEVAYATSIAFQTAENEMVRRSVFSFLLSPYARSLNGGASLQRQVQRWLSPAPQRKPQFHFSADSITLKLDVARAIASLTQPEQQVVALCFFDQLSPAEVAQQLGCSRQTVYDRLWCAYKKLTKKLRDYDPAKNSVLGSGEHRTRGRLRPYAMHRLHVSRPETRDRRQYQ